MIECTGVPSVIAALLPHVAPDSAHLPDRRRRAASNGFDIGAFNRDMVLNNGLVFGSVNANLRHYQMAADALQRADRGGSRALSRAAFRWSARPKRSSSRKGDIKVVIDFAS